VHILGFLAEKKTLSLFFGRNITRVKILIKARKLMHSMTVSAINAICLDCESV
jgi:hypothetical protein